MTEPENDKKPAAGGYTWAQLAPTHGAHSPAIRDPVAAEFMAELQAIATAEGSAFSYLTEPAYKYQIRDWAMAEAQQLLIETWLNEFGWVNDGEVRAAAHYLEKVARRAARGRIRLGLDPIARARLQVSIGVAATLQSDLAHVQRQGAHLVPDFDDEGSDAVS